MSARICSPPMDAHPPGGSLPHSSQPRRFVFGAGLHGLRRNSEPVTTSSPAPTVMKRAVRCLFGPPDPKSGQFAKEKVKESLVRYSEEYEFDFEKGRPMEGAKRFKWETVIVAKSGSSSGVPERPTKKGSSSAAASASASTPTNVTSQISEEDALLIVRCPEVPTIASVLPSSSSASSTTTSSTSTSTTIPTTCPERERRFSSSSPTPERVLSGPVIPASSSSVTSTSQSSSQSSSPEPSSFPDPVASLPSPPSSLEESFGPSSPSQEDSTPLVPSANKKSKITDFMQPKKRRTTSTSPTNSGPSSPGSSTEEKSSTL